MKEFIESIGDAKFIEDLAYMMSKVNVGRVINFRPTYHDEDLSVSIDYLDLNNRSYGRLRNAHINTIGDIIQRWDYLGKIEKAGITTVVNIKIAVLDYLYSKYNKEQIEAFWIRSLAPKEAK